MEVDHDGPGPYDWSFMVHHPDWGDVNVLRVYDEDKDEFNWVEEEYLWTHQRQVTDRSVAFGREIEKLVQRLERRKE